MSLNIFNYNIFALIVLNMNLIVNYKINIFYALLKFEKKLIRLFSSLYNREYLNIKNEKICN